MLPLECLYLNKNALINVVGQPVSFHNKINLVLGTHLNNVFKVLFIFN